MYLVLKSDKSIYNVMNNTNFSLALGLLKLESAQQEHVVLACTMTTDTNATFLEMDLDSNFLLTPIKDSVFSKTPLYLKTKSYCEDEAEAWQRQMKVRTASFTC